MYPSTAPWPLWNIALSLSLPLHLISSFSHLLCLCVSLFFCLFIFLSPPLFLSSSSSFSFFLFVFFSSPERKMNEFHSHVQIRSGNTKQQNNIFPFSFLSLSFKHEEKYPISTYKTCKITSIITIIFLSVSLLLTHHSLKIILNIESERLTVFYKWRSANVEALCP